MVGIADSPETRCVSPVHCRSRVLLRLLRNLALKRSTGPFEGAPASRRLAQAIARSDYLGNLLKSVMGLTSTVRYRRIRASKALRIRLCTCCFFGTSGLVSGDAHRPPRPITPHNETIHQWSVFSRLDTQNRSVETNPKKLRFFQHFFRRKLRVLFQGVSAVHFRRWFASLTPRRPRVRGPIRTPSPKKHALRSGKPETGSR